jgi:hypothetical protein
MTLICKCSHSRGEHDIGNGLERCRRLLCGCGEWRLDPRSLLQEEPGTDAATEKAG